MHPTRSTWLIALLALSPPAPAAPVQTEGDSFASDGLRPPVPWLVRVQAEDGHWSGDEAVGAIGTTALVLTAFAGGSTLPHQGPLHDHMQAGLRWLLSQQDPASGIFGAALGDEAQLLEHAWSTWLVSELAFLAGGQSGVGEANMQAAQALLSAQRADGGFGSARATGWSTFALFAARESGVEVPAPDLQRARSALAAAVVTDAPAEELDVGPLALRAQVGFIALEGPDPTAIEAVQRLVESPETWSRLDPEERSLLAFAAYRIGGTTWEKATRGLRSTVLPRQVTETGESPGRFPAEHGFGDVRATAFGSLTLEVYFRYARVLGSR